MLDKRKLWWGGTLIAAALLLFGCGGGGGGGGGGNADATAVPDSAGANVAAFIAFIAGLDPNDETSEPLTIGDNFVAPTDDTGEPQPLT